MKHYPVPLPLMQEIINVLQTLPWAQVNRIMVPMMQIVQQAEAPQLPEPPPPAANGKSEEPKPAAADGDALPLAPRRHTR